MALSIDIAANTRQAQSQVKNLGESLEDVADALDDVAKDADKSGDKLERTFRNMAQDAKRAGDDVGDSVKKGFKRAEEGAEDFKQEANSTAREAAASFDGSAESIGDAFQEVAANAFSGFGPAGAVAGLAAAAGIGLVTAAIQGANDQTELAKERVAEWAGAFIEAGGTMVTAGVAAARMQDILTDPEKFQEAETNARNWGVAVETAVAAMAGNTGAIDDVKNALDRQKESAAAAATEAQRLAQESGGQLTTLTQAEIAYNNGASALAKMTGEMEAGAARADMLSNSLKQQINDAESATKEVDELGNAVYTLPDGTQIMIDAETGRATQNVSAFKGDLDGIPETVTSTVKVNVDSSAWDRWTPKFKTGVVAVNPRIGRDWE